MLSLATMRRAQALEKTAEISCHTMHRYIVQIQVNVLFDPWIEEGGSPQPGS